jgi:hypothetical protein
VSPRFSHAVIKTPPPRRGDQIVFKLTPNNLNEGGRQRRSEAYFNLDTAKGAFFGRRNITVITDDGHTFDARLSGNAGNTSGSTPKNLRSSPGSRFGEWLLSRRNARPGDEVHVQFLGSGRFLFRHLPASKEGADTTERSHNVSPSTDLRQQRSRTKPQGLAPLSPRMNLLTYSHNSGDKAVPKLVAQPLQAALVSIKFRFRAKSATSLRRTILEHLRELGWIDRVPVTPHTKITITAVRKETGLCLQLGNMARFYADLLKLQLFFHEGRITSAIYVVPTQNAAHLLGDNIAHFSRLTQELGYFGAIITLPILVIGIEGELQ